MTRARRRVVTAGMVVAVLLSSGCEPARPFHPRSPVFPPMTEPVFPPSRTAPAPPPTYYRAPLPTCEALFGAALRKVYEAPKILPDHMTILEDTQNLTCGVDGRLRGDQWSTPLSLHVLQVNPVRTGAEVNQKAIAEMNTAADISTAGGECESESRRYARHETCVETYAGGFETVAAVLEKDVAVIVVTLMPSDARYRASDVEAVRTIVDDLATGAVDRLAARPVPAVD